MNFPAYHSSYYTAHPDRMQSQMCRWQQENPSWQGELWRQHPLPAGSGQPLALPTPQCPRNSSHLCASLLERKRKVPALSVPLAIPITPALASCTSPWLHSSLLVASAEATSKLLPQDTPRRLKAEHCDLQVLPMNCWHCLLIPGTIPGTGGPSSHIQSTGCQPQPRSRRTAAQHKSSLKAQDTRAGSKFLARWELCISLDASNLAEG